VRWSGFVSLDSRDPLLGGEWSPSVQAGLLTCGLDMWLGSFPPDSRQWARAKCPAYSGATVAVFHRLPYSPWAGT